MRDSSKFVRKIIQLRKDVGWSQAELARRCGITTAAINQMEKYESYCSVPVLKKLAEVFAVSIDFLLGNSLLRTHILNSFFIKFGDIVQLNEGDQKIVTALIKRLKL